MLQLFVETENEKLLVFHHKIDFTNDYGLLSVN